MKNIVVAGIGTGIGKTIISSILVEALEADYWKPIQAGDLQNSDTTVVKNLVSSKKSFFYQETFLLSAPMSPHAAAKIDGVEIRSCELKVPKTKNTLIIELAGGLMVPLNSTELNIDLLRMWNAPVILVSKNYLGSINHTLLSIELLKNNKISLLGIIFNGEKNSDSEDFILNYSGVNLIDNVRNIADLSKSSIADIASNIKPRIAKFI